LVAVLSVRLLDDFDLCYDEKPITGLNSPRLQSLLAYLLLHRDAPQSRSHIAFQFWPRSTEAQAHTNLRNLLHRLRRALPEADQFLAAGVQTLQWRSGAPSSLDVADFEAALGKAEAAGRAGNQAGVREALEGAMALYRGDLLPSCYDDWIIPARERLRQRYLGALGQLIRLLEAGREYDHAIHHARRLVRHDPLHEVAYRRLMRLHTLKGDRAGALRVYHTCASTLQQELGVEPSPATQRAYEELLKAEERPAPERKLAPGVLPLVGREDEWAQLQVAWRRAARGPRFALVQGEAGIGKTRLVEELLDWADQQGIASAYARCYAAEGELAYAPVTALLQARPLPPLDDVWLSEVARLLPEVLADRPDLPHPRPMTEAWQRQWLFQALARAVLGGESPPGPLLLVVEDLQWCDRETLDWLHYLLRFDPKARLLVVGTCRPEELDQACPLATALPALQRDARLTLVELGPLDEAETATLAANIAGEELEAAVTRRLYRETEGNPLFVVEALRAGLPAAAERLEVDGLRLPPRVQAVLEARLAQLSPPAQELAGLAATIGRAFTFPVLRAAGDGDEDSLVSGLDELWRRRIVRERGTDAYDFTHDKLREAAYGALSPARRRLLHRQVAHSLETAHAQDLDPVSGQIAAHYERAGLPAQAVPYYLRAGEAASRIYANDEAMASFERGLWLLEIGSWAASRPRWAQQVTARLYEGLGEVQRLTGSHEEARATLERALERVESDEQLRLSNLLVKIGYTWWGQGQYDQALQAYDRAERILGPEPTGPVIANDQPASSWWRQWLEIQYWRMYVYYFLGWWHETAQLVERAEPALELYGTPVQRAWFIGNRLASTLRRERYVVSDDILVEIQDIVAASQEGGDLWYATIAWWFLGLCLALCGELDEAEQELQATLALAHRTENPEQQVYALTWLSIVRRKRGRLEAVREYACRTLAAAEAALMPVHVAVSQANLAWVAWREGNLAEAEELARAAVASWQKSQWAYAFQWTAFWPLLAMALDRHQIPEALDHARAMLDPQQQRLPAELEAPLEEAIQAGERDEPEEAGTHLQRAARLAQETGYL